MTSDRSQVALAVNRPKFSAANLAEVSVARAPEASSGLSAQKNRLQVSGTRQ